MDRDMYADIDYWRSMYCELLRENQELRSKYNALLIAKEDPRSAPQHAERLAADKWALVSEMASALHMLQAEIYGDGDDRLLTTAKQLREM